MPVLITGLYRSKEEAITRVLRTFKDQEDAQNILRDALDRECWSNLSQALNAAYDGQGKYSTKVTIDDQEVEVWHASAGKQGVSSVTLFYYPKKPADFALHLIALGEHATNDLYEIARDFGQEGFPYKRGKRVGVDGRGAR
ncbi:hypothetical protein [Streptomyces silvisoli]|uniref:Uncharacterized protein n=1 Tax=Streptomyces silvisoli TaxID=3034235 RepID=A0ABT5ZTS2_9ACTN|nr:hypothetical protein [Streptomyces silvisoli]MDF3292418.1 hypothetical protein [Streptomyces silvisoli]